MGKLHVSLKVAQNECPFLICVLSVALGLCIRAIPQVVEEGGGRESVFYDNGVSGTPIQIGHIKTGAWLQGARVPHSPLY